MSHAWLQFFRTRGITPTQTLKRRPEKVKGSGTKITLAMMRTFKYFIKERHADSQSVTLSILKGKIFESHAVGLRHCTIGRRMKDLGKERAPMRLKKRNFSAQHHKALRDFLIKLDEILKHLEEGNDENYVFVFTDKSYINQKYGLKFTYQSANKRATCMGRRCGKGHNLSFSMPLILMVPCAKETMRGIL